MKKLIALFLTLSLLLSLSGCALAEEPVKIVFWHSASEAAGALVDKYVQDFNDTVGREKGIRVEAGLRLTRGSELLAESRGEVQFTETGVSGPAGFDLSRAVSLGGEGLLLHLCLLPFREAELLSRLTRRQKQYPELEASELFTGMLHNRLGRTVVKAAGIPANAPLSSLSEEDLRSAARVCTDFILPVRGVDGFEAAQVTAGGLRTDEFDPRTLESRLVPGLFACGEVLDIDGPCGGYNLQWAWASGALAGRLGA